MISPVMLKGNKAGIRLIISPEANMNTILKCLNDKLHATGEYYSNIKPISVTFEGKHLTDDDKVQILDTLRTYGINVDYYSANNQETNINKHKTIIKQQLYSEKNGLFYIGTLKNGQSLTAMESIVIIGDIESGAFVESGGNVIVLGRVEGIVKTGCMGKPDTFMYSLS